jgi:hypothetical protein
MGKKAVLWSPIVTSGALDAAGIDLQIWLWR